MREEHQILLSIGMIFKNEIRCLERCLKSLQPLRDMIPCELVMADTGATDGSRQIAEKYADILFDFEWINDFSAARNAVMDRCSGKWYLSIDCDEWLGGDCGELAAFVANDQGFKYGGIIVRNYQTTELDKSEEYTDFTACRLVKMSTGMRYVGTIHERWPSEREGTPLLLVLEHMFLHHDGYVNADQAAAKAKMERNLKLLHERLEQDPQNLVTLLQCIESSDGLPEYMDYIERGIQGIEARRQGWDLFGAPLVRYAAIVAYKRGLPEAEKYINMARELFPESIYTRIDVEFAAFGQSWGRDDYQECIQSGERYLKALADYEAGNYNRIDGLVSTLALRSSNWKLQVQIFTAASYLYEGRPEQARNILKDLLGGQMTAKHVGDCVRVYTHLHSRSHEDTAPLITKLWDEICQPTPSEERAVQRKTEFIRMASEVFLPAYQEDESGREDFCRHAYTLFLPLEGKCILGDASAILAAADPSVLTEKLGRVDDLERLPVPALYHALECGASFPTEDRPLKLEELDMLAGRMAQDKERLFLLARKEAENLAGASVQHIAWARGLALSAVHSSDWKDGGDGVEVARAYAKAEQAFLPACYAPSVLTPKNLNILPPMHRFGWYLTEAFNKLDAGDAAGYVRLLREGLAACESVKGMVAFLLNNTPELKGPSDELKAMAEQIRAVLAQFAPGDPAVAALKQSEAYQKVAYLIEGMEPPVVGGQMQ